MNALKPAAILGCVRCEQPVTLLERMAAITAATPRLCGACILVLGEMEAACAGTTHAFPADG